MLFCSKCGTRLHESMKYCYGCGQKIEPLRAEQKMIKSDIPKYDDEAIKLYLSNLQTLEAAQRKLKQDLQKIDDRIAEMGKPGTYVYRDRLLYGMDENGESAACADPNAAFRVQLDKKIRLGLASVLLLTFTVAYCVWQQFFSQMVSAILLGCTGAILTAFIVMLIVKMVHASRDARREKKAYLKFVQTDKERLNCEDAERVYLNKRRNRLCYEYGEAKNLLRKSYEADIIPLQLRNIGSVYYLHNCVATSEEPFSVVLARCRLSAQNITLSELVAQKSDEVLRQAFVRVQNPEWLRTADEHLQELLGMETDKAVLEKYYCIAATHAQITTWIRLADCMKE